MENTSHNYVRIENAKFGRRGIVYTSLIFILSFIICIIIGITGPSVIQIRNDGINQIKSDIYSKYVWNGVLEDMTQLNQMFWLTVKVIRYENNNLEEIGELTTM